ncbi:hypothetical protein Tco_0596893 [Tanacetum coccineum]
MNSCRWFHLYDVLDRRAQLDDRHVSHLAFDGSDRMVGETVVGPPIPSPPFSPFLGDDAIKVLEKINDELQSDTHKLIEKLIQEKDSQEKALGEFNSTLENVIKKLCREKDNPNDFYGFVYDTDDDASISVTNDSLDDDEVERGRSSKRIRVTHEEMVKDENAKKG